MKNKVCLIFTLLATHRTDKVSLLFSGKPLFVVFQSTKREGERERDGERVRAWRERGGRGGERARGGGREREMERYSMEKERERVSWLVDALSPVNHKGLYQG